MRKSVLVGTILVLTICSFHYLFAQERGVTPLSAKASPKAGATCAVVIGISDYQDPAIPDLRFADRDAEAFANFLRSPAGGSLDEDHLKVLLNQQATIGQIVSALDWLMEVAKKGDNTIIYFSGHGDVETKTKFQLGYLLNWDSPPDTYMAGAFNIRDLQAIVATLSEKNEARVTLITDACRSGKLAGSLIGGPQLTNANLAERFANEIKILSCQPDEYSIEGEQWGGGRGAFSYHLVEGLYGMADNNHDLSVNLLELGRYIQDKVSEEVSPNSQMPMFIGNNKEELATVNPVILEKIRQEKTGQVAMFKPTETKGIEDRILSQVDSATQELYAHFNRALKAKRFLFPAEDCADEYYTALTQLPEMKELYSSMRRNYAAALQDDAQQVINGKMKSEYSTCVKNFREEYEKYKHYPDYLQRTIELLGEQHYMYPILRARLAYFEGYVMQLKQWVGAKEGNDPDASLAFYQEALQYNPGMPLAMLAMAKFLSYDDPHTADSLYLQILDQNPNWIFGYYEYLEFIRTKLKDDNKFRIWLDKAYSIDPGSMLVWARKVEFHVQKGEFREAAKSSMPLLDTINVSECNFINPVLTLLYLQQYDQLKVILENLIIQDPKDPKYHAALSMLYNSMGDEEKARKAVQEAAELGGENNFALFGFSTLYYFETENLATLVPYYKKWLEEYPSSEVHYPRKKDLVWPLTILGQYEEANQYLSQLPQDAQPDELELLYRGFYHIAVKDYANAEKVLKQGIALYGLRNYRLMLLLGHVFLHNGKAEEGRDLIKKSYAISREQSYTHIFIYYLTASGGLFRNAGRFEEAAQLIEPMLEVAPDDPMLYIELARTAAAAGDNTPAMSYVEKALKLGYQNLHQLNHNINLMKLHGTEEWETMMKKYFPEEYKD